jgi:hypothetical protein
MSRKTERTFCGELDIELEVGCMVNLTEWVPAQHHKQHFGSKIEMPYKFMTPTVMLNEVVLLDQSIDCQTSIHHQFVDHNPGAYTLQVGLTGDFERFNHISDSLTVYPMLRIKGIWIEGLCMHNVWEDLVLCRWDRVVNTEPGTEYMGRPGVQTLVFETPIYQWLLKQDQKSNYFIKEKNHA